MNALEKSVYDILKHNPRLKRFVRNQYQRLFDIFPAPKPVAAYQITAREGFFFGFHDHKPFSGDNTKLLAHRYTIPLRMPEPGDTIEIGYFDGEDYNQFHAVCTSKAWSWHLGAKLQWRGTQNEMIFNDHQKGKNVSRIVDIDTGKDTPLPAEIATVSPDGKWAVGYSFSRVENCMPGYGYPYPVHDPEKEAPLPQRHGIHRINLETGYMQLLFSIADIAEIEPEKNMKGAMHFFSHAVFSPNSKRFLFLHRWITGSVYNRFSRMVSCDIDGKNVHIFPTTGMVSHIGWRDTDHVIAYCRIPGHDDRYILFHDMDKDQYQIIGKKVFTSDGHPSFDPTGRWIVTDSYPDRQRVQSLILYDTETGTRYDIARLPTPKKFQGKTPFTHWSCDLHPRWDRTGRYVCFDATYTGKRSLCTIDLGNDLKRGDVRHVSAKRPQGS